MSRPALAAADWAAVKAWFEGWVERPGPQRAGGPEPALVAALARGELNAAQVEELRSLLAEWAAVEARELAASGPGTDAAGADSPGVAPSPALGAASGLGSAAFLSPLDARALTAAAPAAEPPLLPVGLRLGAWEVLGRLGVGGMAEVWSARRADGAWQGEAAIKVLKRGMDSAAVLARFALEQQALARLAHPHIARLLDAGRTPAGLPYFVMEKIVGQPIDQACRGLPVADRLALFLQLTDAVAYAHRHLLVHRDLKPSNVMVDDQGQVKLLDFGIAKALDPLDAQHRAGPQADDPAALTQAGQRPFTPHYASPEQVKGEPVGTATDLYSLGVLLYVMLTGLRPYGRQAATPQQALRSVLEETPTRPSELSPEQVGDPDWLATRRRLRGDLDNILLKALEKEPERRYASVDALAEDLRAHLEGRPVSARTASWTYLTGRFVQRHRLPVALAALLGLSLVAGVGVSVWQARQADLARDAAQRHLADVRKLANAMIFEVNEGLREGATQARRVLVKTAADYLEQQAGFDRQTDEDRLQLAQALAGLARLEGHSETDNLGEKDASLAHYRQALGLLEPTPAAQADNPRWQAALVAALEGLASSLRTSDPPQALALMQRTLHHAQRRAALEPQSLDARADECAAHLQWTAHHYQVDRLYGQRLLAQAVPAAEQALACTRALTAFAPQQPRAWRLFSNALHVQAGLMGAQGLQAQGLARERESLAAAEHAISLPQAALLPSQIRVAALVHLAHALRKNGLDDEATTRLEQALVQVEADLKADPRNQWFRNPYAVVAHNLLYQDLRTGHEARMPERHAHFLRSLSHAGRPARELDAQAETAWMDTAMALGWFRLGQPARGAALSAQLVRLRDSGTLNLQPERLPEDGEMLTTIGLTEVAAAAAAGHTEAALAVGRRVLLALDLMRACRDPADVFERLNVAEYLAQLAQIDLDPSPAAQAWARSLRERLRELLAPWPASAAAAPLISAPGRVELRWLARQPMP